MDEPRIGNFNALGNCSTVCMNFDYLVLNIFSIFELMLENLLAAKVVSNSTVSCSIGFPFLLMSYFKSSETAKC